MTVARGHEREYIFKELEVNLEIYPKGGSPVVLRVLQIPRVPTWTSYSVTLCEVAVRVRQACRDKCGGWAAGCPSQVLQLRPR